MNPATAAGYGRKKMAKRYNGAALFLTLSINVEDTTEKVSQFMIQMKLMRRYQLMPLGTNVIKVPQ